MVRNERIKSILFLSIFLKTRQNSLIDSRCIALDETYSTCGSLQFLNIAIASYNTTVAEFCDRLHSDTHRIFVTNLCLRPSQCSGTVVHSPI